MHLPFVSSTAQKLDKACPRNSFLYFGLQYVLTVKKDIFIVNWYISNHYRKSSAEQRRDSRSE